MPNDLIESFIDRKQITGPIPKETRVRMSQMLEFDHPAIAQREEDRVKNLAPSKSVIQNPLSSIVPALVSIIGKATQELEINLPRLLSLNPSRRDAIAHHLEKLAGLNPSPQSPSTNLDPARGLRRWVEGPRSQIQNLALKTYFEELAIVALGQIILLKCWSDRGVRVWSESDLGRLNWVLSTTLKPHIPLDREGWQITRPNLYSWYNPGPELQREIWLLLEPCKITDEGPGFLISLLCPLRRAQTEGYEPSGYDLRFFSSLWDHINLFGFNPEPDNGSFRRNKIVFSPTLRDGLVTRAGPSSITWIGLEASSFQFMMAELTQIWWGPTAPPFWSIGSGLEVHTRDQLALALGSSKPSVLCRIADMEACDAAIVIEEQTIRAQGRSANASRFRDQLEKLPYFKKLKSPGTSLGGLRACVALSKLRPGGILLWMREEPLCAKDGNEILNFLLDRSKLVSEWDFSELEHSLPASVSLYPKYLYLFQKETNLESRLTHRPIRHCIQGLMRSHVELSLVLEDAFKSGSLSSQARGQWKVLSHSSPTPQKDWLEKWPDPTSQSVIRSLDLLRTASLPLANFTTIRPTPDGDPSRNGKWSVQMSLRGFWLTGEHDSDGRKLILRGLPRPGQEAQGSGFLVLVPDESWAAPLSAYLTSDLVQKWLDYHAERRGERWILNEQVVKWIPIPKSLLIKIGVPSALEGCAQSSSNITLSPEWQSLVAEVAYYPGRVKEALEKLPQDEKDEKNFPIHATVFTSAARALDHIFLGQSRLFSLVTSDGRIRWRELLDILPKSECVAVSLHPKIRISGSLPPHLPIGKIERVKSPFPGILLATESGFSLHIASENTLLINILLEQLQNLAHPTWNELLQYLSLPRKMELAESTALDILRSHGEQSARLKELRELLSACQLF